MNTFAVLLIALMLYITAFDGSAFVQRLSFGLQDGKNNRPDSCLWNWNRAGARYAKP